MITVGQALRSNRHHHPHHQKDIVFFLFLIEPTPNLFQAELDPSSSWMVVFGWESFHSKLLALSQTEAKSVHLLSAKAALFLNFQLNTFELWNYGINSQIKKAALTFDGIWSIYWSKLYKMLYIYHLVGQKFKLFYNIQEKSYYVWHFSSSIHQLLFFLWYEPVYSGFQNWIGWKMFFDNSSISICSLLAHVIVCVFVDLPLLILWSNHKCHIWIVAESILNVANYDSSSKKVNNEIKPFPRDVPMSALYIFCFIYAFMTLCDYTNVNTVVDRSQTSRDM